MVKTQLEYFFAALRFFTRLPVPAWVGHSAEQLNGAARYFPLVGILVGVIGATVTWAASLLLPLSLAIIAGMAATLLATGAFHEDGFADAVDGFGGGWEKEQVLAIMKDSRVGSYGAIGVALLLLAKWNALLELSEEALLAAIVAGHAVSRFASTSLIYSLEYVRDEGKSKPLANRMGIGELLTASIFGLLPCLLLPYWETLLALLLVAVVTWLAGRYFLRRIGGYTGDCLGAAQQVAELAFYVGLLVQWNSG
jgi:adenosylcobinamide-GDP ribazoletransferase